MKGWCVAIIVAILAATWGGPAAAIEEIGVYFNVEATNYCEWLPMPAYVPIPVYVTLTGVSAPVQGFEFSYTMTSPDSFYRLSATVGGVGPQDSGNSSSVTGGWYRVTLPTPQPAGDRMVLVTWSLMLISVPGHNVVFGLGAAPDPRLPGLLPVVDGGVGAGLRRVPIHGSGYGGLSAWWGGCEALAKETSSFGAIKALYR